MEAREKKEDYREEPICRRRNGAYQKTANYLCDGKILCIDFARKFDVKAADETRSGGVGVFHPFGGIGQAHGSLTEAMGLEYED
ncbi:MAG: hypothetical protein J6U08_05350 [Paludibacteraceae bacterium]|nr:hypothetical protein [Paludibacteraceae bacterium]